MEKLKEILGEPAAECKPLVLEIASGTGCHVEVFAPALPRQSVVCFPCCEHISFLILFSSRLLQNKPVGLQSRLHPRKAGPRRYMHAVVYSQHLTHATKRMWLGMTFYPTEYIPEQNAGDDVDIGRTQGGRHILLTREDIDGQPHDGDWRTPSVLSRGRTLYGNYADGGCAVTMTRNTEGIGTFGGPPSSDPILSTINKHGSAAHPNVVEAAPLDAGTPFTNWPATVQEQKGTFEMVCVSNVTHISPFKVTKGICAGAGHALGVGGSLVVYGPFKIDGTFTTESNE